MDRNLNYRNFKCSRDFASNVEKITKKIFFSVF
jgi:hypothetical protein